MRGELRFTIKGLAPVVLSPGDLSGARAGTDPAAEDPVDGETVPAAPEVRAVAETPDDRALGIRRFEVTVEGWSFLVTAEREARAALRDRAAEGRAGLMRHGPTVVRAPMPGRIVRSWVAVGDTVEAGQRLLSVEAMKMENEVRAPRAGEVAHIAVTVGSSVEFGDELVIVR